MSSNILTRIGINIADMSRPITISVLLLANMLNYGCEREQTSVTTSKALPVQKSAVHKPEQKLVQKAPENPPRGWLLNDAESQVQAQRKQQKSADRPLDPELQLAMQVRPWTECDVEGTQIKIFMKTRWLDGVMQVRLAMLGPRDQLNTFIGGVKEFKLKMEDQQGSEISNYSVWPSDFQWAPTEVNNGTPTLAFESSVPCSFETYKTYANWHFDWQF